MVKFPGFGGALSSTRRLPGRSAHLRAVCQPVFGPCPACLCWLLKQKYRGASPVVTVLPAAGSDHGHKRGDV